MGIRYLWVVCFVFFNLNLFAQCLDGDCENGQGVLNFSSGTKYIGDFKNGKFSGYGIMLSANGDRFLGTWNNNQRYGYGKLLLNDGRRYEGEFKENKFNGYGTFLYKDQSIYTGFWEDSYVNGLGKYKKSTGEIKEGIWSNGALVETKDITNLMSGKVKKLRDCNRVECNGGFGIFYFPDGSKWEGEMLEGVPGGVGGCYYSNGDIYLGQWDTDQPNGYGEMIYSNGKKLESFWEDGKPVQKSEENHEETIISTNSPFNKQVKIWVVIVGASRYVNLPQLKYTDDDAYQLYAFLKSPEGGAVPDEQIKLLIDEAATRDNILKSMKNTFSMADKNDVIFLYFAGHGINGYFLPVESNGYQDKLSYDEIKKVLESSEAKHKLCIADACYSGSLLAQRSAFGESLDLFYSTFENTKGGTAFLLSSKQEETSLEASGGIRQGVFSYFLLKGLKGESDQNGDDIITIKELYDYVFVKVREFSAMAQSPVIAGNYDNNMPVGVIRK